MSQNTELLDALAQSPQGLHELRETFANIADKFITGQEKNAMQELQGSLSHLQGFAGFANSINDALPTQSLADWTALNNKLVELIAQLLGALQGKDYCFAADLLHYGYPSLVKDYCQQFNSISMELAAV